ncbi:MAG: ABC transporter permease [Spiribacter sp.]|jgi:spermidine/putrescine transport system permease protein|nr:ABC transporter permease [Spiribacter sp.]MDR9489628.1 ABC transporter permease [Spiribacter sp.]
MSGKNLERSLRGFWFALMMFLYAPLAVVVLFSFNSINSSARFAGFSLEWYEKLFANDAIISALVNTLVLAASSSVLAVIIGGLLGYGLYRYRRWRMGWLIWLIYLPVIMPDIVFGIAEMTFFVSLHDLFGLFKPGLSTMIIAHVTFQVPFVALLVNARLLSLDPQLFEACNDLYANPWQRARFFIFPVLWPAVLSSVLLALTLSIDDFVISFFTAGPDSTTLPIYIWSAIKKGVTPEVNAIATLMIGSVFIAALMSLFIHRRSVQKDRT